MRARTADAARACALTLALCISGCDGAADVPEAIPPVAVESHEGLDPAVLAIVETHFRRVAEAPGDADLHGRLGMVFEANGLWEEAARSYANAEILDPAEPLWSYRRSVALYETGRIEQSLELLRRCAARSEEAAPHYTLGLVLVQTGELAGAEAAFRRAKAIEPQAVLPDVGLARVSLERGDHEAARSVLVEVLEAHPDYKHARFLLGRALRELGMPEAAERELRLGVGSQPSPMTDPRSDEINDYAVNYPSRMKQAQALMLAGRYEAAVEVLEALHADRSAVIPRDAMHVLMNLAAVHRELGHPGREERVYLEALELDPNDARVHNGYAGVLSKTGRAEEALTHLERAVVLAPNYGKAHHNLALVYAGLGRDAEAEEEFGEAIRLGWYQAYKGYARFLDVRGRPDEGRAKYAAALLIRPDDFEAHNNLAVLLSMQGDHAAAVGHFRETVRLKPDLAHARHNLGDALVRDGQMEEAVEAYREALRLDPGLERTRRNLELVLHRLEGHR